MTAPKTPQEKIQMLFLKELQMAGKHIDNFHYCEKL